MNHKLRLLVQRGIKQTLHLVLIEVNLVLAIARKSSETHVHVCRLVQRVKHREPLRQRVCPPTESMAEIILMVEILVTRPVSMELVAGQVQVGIAMCERVALNVRSESGPRSSVDEGEEGPESGHQHSCELPQ